MVRFFHLAQLIFTLNCVEAIAVSINSVIEPQPLIFIALLKAENTTDEHLNLENCAGNIWSKIVESVRLT
ncbi:hypothetical protein BpHYR1_048637, partial [Brachionus plicatilis]